MVNDRYATQYENKHEDINDFIERKRDLGRSERTLKEYSRTLRKFFHEIVPDVPPGEVTVEHVENYLRELSSPERACSANTKRRYIESLSAFYSYAMKRPRFDDITANPAAVVLEELPRERKDRPDCATWENGKQIIHAMPDPRNKTAAIIMAKTGARISEVLSLEMDNLLLDEGFIHFQNRKAGRATVNPIDTETVHAIERFQFVRQPESEYLFTSIRGNRVSREQVRRAVREAAVDTGIMAEGEHRFHKKFTPHTYRTVFTTLMRYEGMSEFMLRYLRGDADDGEIDLYTKMDQATIRDQYLNCMKTLDL